MKKLNINQWKILSWEDFILNIKSCNYSYYIPVASAQKYSSYEQSDAVGFLAWKYAQKAYWELSIDKRLRRSEIYERTPEKYIWKFSQEWVGSFTLIESPVMRQEYSPKRKRKIYSISDDLRSESVFYFWEI